MLFISVVLTFSFSVIYEYDPHFDGRPHGSSATNTSTPTWTTHRAYTCSSTSNRSAAATTHVLTTASDYGGIIYMPRMVWPPQKSRIDNRQPIMRSTGCIYSYPVYSSFRKYPMPNDNEWRDCPKPRWCSTADGSFCYFSVLIILTRRFPPMIFSLPISRY